MEVGEGDRQTDRQTDRQKVMKVESIDGFRGGAEGAPAPPFISCILKTFLYDPYPSNRPENLFIKCSLILSSETLTLLNFAS